MAKIILVEDEINIASFIERGLREFGHEVSVVYDGNAGWELLQNESFDLLILDIIMPGMNGLELCRMYRQRFGYHSPVVMLTALGTTDDIVKGLDAGADDYLVKPFAVDELTARVESVLRRYHKSMQDIHVLDVTIHTATRLVEKENRTIALTKKEYELLLYLVQNKNIALYRDTMYEKVWHEEEFEQTRTLDLHIQRLRKKLDWHRVIQTVYKIGYMLEVKDEVQR